MCRVYVTDSLDTLVIKPTVVCAYEKQLHKSKKNKKANKFTKMSCVSICKLIQSSMGLEVCLIFTIVAIKFSNGLESNSQKTWKLLGKTIKKI